MDGYLRIGDLAKRVGVTVKAVRHYEAEGLLPAALRTNAGYRYFRQEDLAVLWTITALKRMGFSLSEIREVRRPCPRGLLPRGETTPPECD